MGKLLGIAVVAALSQTGCSILKELTPGNAVSCVRSCEHECDDCPSCDGCPAGTNCEPKRSCAHGHYGRAIDDWLTGKRAKKCAKRSLQAIECRPTRHFKAGFVKAYVDVAMGKRGTLPVIPPRKYWATYYRAPAGTSHAHQWFDGYRSGAEHAYTDGLPQWKYIATTYSGSHRIDNTQTDPLYMTTGGHNSE